MSRFYAQRCRPESKSRLRTVFKATFYKSLTLGGLKSDRLLGDFEIGAADLNFIASVDFQILTFGDSLLVDESAVAAAHVFNIEIIPDLLDKRVMTARHPVIQDDVIVSASPNGDFFGDREVLAVVKELKPFGLLHVFKPLSQWTIRDNSIVFPIHFQPPSWQ
jgi:hypothetical protein